MTVPITKDDENYTTVMVSLSNHESLSFDRLRMTRVEINNNSGLSTHFQMKSLRVSMAGDWIPACTGETTYCGCFQTRRHGHAIADQKTEVEI
jgi:hypothetical protein